MNQKFDIIWIGTGQATLSTVPKLLAAGNTVAIIEQSFFGGTCVNNGCTPTKTLVAAARAIHQTQRGNDFGFSIGELKVDFTKVMSLQQNNRRKATEFIENRLAREPNCTIFKGTAKFIGTHSVEVNQQQLSAQTIVINAGTRPRLSAVAGIENIKPLDNQSLLDLTERPKHLAIIGGSYIGLEFAQIFRRLGSQVTVFVRDAQLVPREDADIAEITDQVLRAEGIEFIYQSELTEIIDNTDQQLPLRLAYQTSNGEQHLNASHILFAIGRQSNSDLLNVSRASIELDKRGNIVVDEHAVTSQQHIYAIGDINGRGAFTHTSVNDGEVFWDHYSQLMSLDSDRSLAARKISDRTMVYSMFIDPPLARIGLSETQARNSDGNYLMASMPMRNIARAREKQETAGLVKIIVDSGTEQIVGATVFGTGGDEVIGVFAAFMHTGQSYKEFRRVVFAHPTVGELMPWALDELVQL